MSDDAEVKRVRHVGNTKTIGVAAITVAGAIIVQLIQVRASDAQKLEYVAAGVSLDAKIDKLSDRIFDLTQRITKIETAREAEAVAGAAPAPLIKSRKK